ncbi:MAG TPA: polymer-forming cytoskeletal protein [Gemmatimonadaceae bacterium]|nr:polymer-forming cytoskeletal protein [Gemmatimonadaceae bacterium]
MAIFSGKEMTEGGEPTKSGAPANGNALSIIAAGTTINGDVDTDGVIRIEGRVEGSIRAARQVLIGRQGSVLGDISTREAVIGGKVEGTITATERLEVQSTSLIVGDINTRAIAVIEGGKINGTVRISDAKELPHIDIAPKPANAPASSGGEKSHTSGKQRAFVAS